MNNFEIPKVVQDNCDIDAAKVIFEQSEKALTHTNKVADNCTDRAYKIIGFVIPIFTACLTYFVYLLQQNTINFFFVFTLFVSCIFLGISLVLSLQIIQHYPIKPVGLQPKEIAIEEIFKSYGYDNPYTIKDYYILLANINQQSITQNKQKNNERVKKCTQAIIFTAITITSPIIGVFLYLLSHYFV